MGRWIGGGGAEELHNVNDEAGIRSLCLLPMC